jgi:hypothetical protein
LLNIKDLQTTNIILTGHQWKGLIIMYHQIHSLRKNEGFSIQRIADYLQINFRTARKLLTMSEEEFDNFMDKKFSKPCLLDSYKEFIIRY